MVQGTAGAARFASSNTTNNSSINTTNNNSSSNTTNINHSSRDTTRSQKKCCATVPSQRRSTQAESNGNVQIWINAGWKPARPYQAESLNMSLRSICDYMLPAASQPASQPASLIMSRGTERSYFQELMNTTKKLSSN